MSVGTTSENINRVIEPLVDALSQLVLETFGGSIADVMPHCVKLANATSELVDVAQQVAISAEDEQIVVEITDIINHIASQIDNLVNNFTNFVQDRTNSNLAKAFAQSAKEVGEAINALVLATDETSQKRMTALVRKAVETTKNLEDDIASGNRSKIFNTSRECHDMNQTLVEVSRRAAWATSHEQKRRLLNAGADGVSRTIPQLLDTAKLLADAPNDAVLIDQFNSFIVNLRDAYKQIIEAIKIDTGSHFDRLANIVEIAVALVESAKKLQATSSNLVKAINTQASKETIMKAAQEAKVATDEFLKYANLAAENINDLVRREVIKKAIADLKKAAEDLQKAAEAAIRGDANAKQMAARAYADLLNAAQRVVFGTKPQASQEYPIHLDTEALESVLQQLLDAAERKDINEMIKKANDLSEIAKKLQETLQQKAQQTSDPEERKKILAVVDELRKAVADVLAAAKEYAKNPTPENLKKLKEAQKKLLEVIQKARSFETTPAGFEQRQVVGPSISTINPFELEPSPNDHPLVAAAKEQARAALDVIREAEKYAENDPELQKKIQQAADEVRNWVLKVLEAARRVAANPNDLAAQAALSDAQKGLAAAIQALVNLAKGKTKKEVDEALRSLNEATKDDPKASAATSKNAAEFLKRAETLLKDIMAIWGEGVKTDVKTGVMKARELAAKVNDLAKLLEEIVPTVTAEKFKKTLLNGARIIRDNGLKLKILAAVKAAGGEDDAGQVAAAARGLAVQIKQIMNDVSALSLQYRVQQTEKQAMILKKIAEAVRKGRV